MAIVNCPECNKKISDRAPSCDNCGFVISGHDTQSLARKRAVKQQEKLNRLTAHSMLAMLSFIAGIAGTFYFPESESPWLYYGALGLTILGFVWYLLTRAQMLMLKRKG